MQRRLQQRRADRGIVGGGERIERRPRRTRHRPSAADDAMPPAAIAMPASDDSGRHRRGSPPAGPARSSPASIAATASSVGSVAPSNRRAASITWRSAGTKRGSAGPASEVMVPRSSSTSRSASTAPACAASRSGATALAARRRERGRHRRALRRRAQREQSRHQRGAPRRRRALRPAGRSPIGRRAEMSTAATRPSRSESVSSMRSSRGVAFMAAAPSIRRAESGGDRAVPGPAVQAPRVRPSLRLRRNADRAPRRAPPRRRLRRPA